MVAAVVVLGLGAAVTGTGTATATAIPAAAPQSINDYIVVLQPSVNVAVYAPLLDRRDGVDLEQVFPTSVNGLHARLTATAFESLARDPRVLFVAPNRRFTATAQTLPAGVDRIDGEQTSWREPAAR